MTSRLRFVVVGVMALAIVLAMVLSHGFYWTWNAMAWNDPALLGRDFTMSRLLGYVAAMATAAFVFMHKPTFTLANEVVEELSKVTWPNKQETGNATVVVVIATLISAAFLGVFDAVWLWLTDLLLGVTPPPQG